TDVGRVCPRTALRRPGKIEMRPAWRGERYQRRDPWSAADKLQWFAGTTLIDVCIKAALGICGLGNSEVDAECPWKYRRRERREYWRRDQQAQPGRGHQPFAIEKNFVSRSDDHSESGKHDKRCTAIKRSKSSAGKGHCDRHQTGHDSKDVDKDAGERVDRATVDFRRAIARMAGPSARQRHEQCQPK